MKPTKTLPEETSGTRVPRDEYPAVHHPGELPGFIKRTERERRRDREVFEEGLGGLNTIWGVRCISPLRYPAAFFLLVELAAPTHLFPC